MSEQTWVFEGVGDLTYEDGGMAAILEISGDRPDEDDGEFVRLQSWSERDEPSHPMIDALKDKRVRVTVQIVEDVA